MNFGQAIEEMKDGKKVQREGWNGKGMWVFLDSSLYGDDGETYAPCIVMYTAQGTYQPGWLASQADMLADDWGEVV